jgi:hypothetical protein
MKITAVLATVAFVFSVGSALACEWMKSAKLEQSVKAPTSTVVATLGGPQSTPVKTSTTKPR